MDENNDCLTAEWDAEENIAVVPYLNEKTTQHMGITVNGKCILLPEEAVFLLEKGVIKVEHNKSPLSVEEAYSVMLKGKLAVEKYQVYTHLSQQGFIVVRHQARIGPSYLKAMNLSKKIRKRKADESSELPEEKRLNFSGVFPSNSDLANVGNNPSHECPLTNDTSLSNDKFITSNTLNNDVNTSVSNDKCITSNNFNKDANTINDKVELDLSNKDKSSHVDEVDLRASSDKEAISNSDVTCSTFTRIDSIATPEKERNICVKEKTKEVGHIEISVKDIKNYSNLCIKNKEDKIVNTIEKVGEANTKENEIKDSESRFCITDIENVNDVEIVNNEEIDKETIKKDNDGDTNDVIIEENEKCDINIEDFNSNYEDDDYDSTDGKLLPNLDDISLGSLDSILNPSEKLYESDNSSSNSSIIQDEDSILNLSEKLYASDNSSSNSSIIQDEDSILNPSEKLYKSDNSSSNPSIIQDEDSILNPSEKLYESDNSSSPSIIQDEDVTLVRVLKKKEKKPLAVIDLFSDEDTDASESKSEENGKNLFEDSDEEIQILDYVPGTGTYKESSHCSVNQIKSESTEVKNESSNIKIESNKIIYPNDWLNADMICIQRPLPHLYPLRCKPSKEAYVLYPQQRSQSNPNQPRTKQIWKSFKDIQAYQRDRQQYRQRNSFVPRPPVSFRDQNDAFSSQFNSPGYSRDMGFGRNHNYSASTGDSFYQSGCNTRGILISPSLGGPRNYMPFSMNPHELQNLSVANPAAFVNDIQNTVYSVASSMVSDIFNQHLNPMISHPSYPTPFNNSNFMNLNSHHNNLSVPIPPLRPNPAGYTSYGRNDFSPVRFPPESPFPDQRNTVHESPYVMENNYNRCNNYRPRNFPPCGPRFPYNYRSVHRKRNWNDVKDARETDLSNPDSPGSDIEEVPINLNRFLYSDNIKPLVHPGKKLPVADGLKALKLTPMADLLNTKGSINSFLPSTLSLEISFDVYLPNSNYRRSEPSVPKYRIIVVRASDPSPSVPELVNLQRKWKDGAVIQVAVVDHGDVSFYSFNSGKMPELVPFDSAPTEEEA